ncbi:GT-D fold domain-containing glycosyltransferase [Vagococcus fluvialis]|uniref:GT-D fold domain-containing glycosyltransferase n=1 Tax=Vagococcus fluvialis TaxID=2738 RepID=UPI001D0B4807|nr:GT-D fold domain-containing glycosyltransferase [Vagococcus fluvialis]UDM70610.1 GT-D fold domain-containing protein [Vagococcus fluvialis]UDM78030.1 GT-D fold domain-containing protein [Vagococcus fluvialis]UDM82299.1 GT-D fold domain-containing protein [Vagococcus fluvialis]
MNLEIIKLKLIILKKKMSNLFSVPYNIYLEKYGEVPIVLDFDETIDLIITKEKSISRFGDGELGLIECDNNPGFQKIDFEMSKRLKKSLKNTSGKNMLVCIPSIFEDRQLEFRSEKSKNYWKNYLKYNRHLWYKHLDFNYVYGASTFTRHYIASEKKDEITMKNYFDKIKLIWKDKKILVVEGKMTRMGVGNDLFDNARCVKRILGPAENAFSKYEQLYLSITGFLENNEGYIVILALGPTASILSQDISANGFRALDMGHIDIEYEWYLNKAFEKSIVPSKYVNEHHDGILTTENDFFTDTSYESQIVEII